MQKIYQHIFQIRSSLYTAEIKSPHLLQLIVRNFRAKKISRFHDFFAKSRNLIPANIKIFSQPRNFIPRISKVFWPNAKFISAKF